MYTIIRARLYTIIHGYVYTIIRTLLYTIIHKNMYTIILKNMYTIIHECNVWNAWLRVHGDVSAYGYPTPTLTLLTLVLAILRRNTGWGRMVNMGRIKELGAGSCATAPGVPENFRVPWELCLCWSRGGDWVVVWGGSGSGRPVANSKRSNERRKWERRTKSKRRKKNLLSLLLFYFYV